MTTDPAHTRTNDPQTSHQAASDIGATTDSQFQVLVALRAFGPCTHVALVAGYNECVARGLFTPQTDQGIRSRCAALVEKRLAKQVGVDPTGSPTGRGAAIWQAVGS